MSVGFVVDCFLYEIGHPDMLFSFFSTIAYRLENNHWGSKYPFVMIDLYNGRLKTENVNQAKTEVIQIKEGLEKCSPNEVIWDIDNISTSPPWGDNIPHFVTNLNLYFASEDGRAFTGLLIAAIETSLEIEDDIILEYEEIS